MIFARIGHGPCYHHWNEIFAGVTWMFPSILTGKGGLFLATPSIKELIVIFQGCIDSELTVYRLDSKLNTKPVQTSSAKETTDPKSLLS